MLIDLEQLTIRNAILCEDVRQEKSNKFILIGVFANNILVGDTPASVAVALYIEAVSKVASGELFLRYSGPGEGSALIGLNYTASQKDASFDPVITIVAPRIDVLMEKEGTFKIELSEDQRSWHTLVETK